MTLISPRDAFLRAEWLAFSGLPAALNEARSNGWLVFRTLVDLDCRDGILDGEMEVSIEELAMRSGLKEDMAPKVLEAIRKKGFIKLYLPELAAEPALIRIVTPIATPIPPQEVARNSADPHMRDPSLFAYASAIESPVDDARIQQVVDWYLNLLSQKMNSFILEQIEFAAGRFPLDDIHRMIERGARHNIRAMGWVIRELLREQRAGKRLTGE